MARKAVTYVCIGDEEVEASSLTDEELRKHGYGYLCEGKPGDAEKEEE